MLFTGEVEKSSGFSVIAFLIVFACIFGGCNTGKKSIQKGQKRIQEQILNSSIFNNGFTGFSLYDPSNEKWLYNHQSDKYFTGASNTKIFTLFTSLEILGDSMPALIYFVRNDSMFFWGTGDPSFLHPYLEEEDQLLPFLQNRKEQLVFNSGNFMDNRFGEGWAWDDYLYYYQAEKSPMPIYGNVVRINKSNQTGMFDVNPAYFEQFLHDNAQLSNIKARVLRKEVQNIFEYNKEDAFGHTFQGDIPFKYSDELFLTLLSDAVGKNILLNKTNHFPPKNRKTLYHKNADALYKLMMQPSDNFIAEQLLLMCAYKLTDTLNTQKTINFALTHLLNHLHDRPLWRDGSGLSRYNLFTPRSIVIVLDKLLKNHSQQKILSYFPAGGESGTIKDWYGGFDKPYIYAKTGTLSNVHCLSGYIITKGDKLLIFSFMHNNFPTDSRPYKKEMERILREIYLSF